MSPDGPHKLLRWALPLLAVVGASSWFLTNVEASDMWWHLAAGRDFFAHGAVPRADPFSFTAEPTWVNHEWLWGVVAYFLYRVDPQLVAWANFALLALTSLLAYEAARRDSASPHAAVVATWIATASAHWYFDLRPQLVTLFGSVAILATRRWRLAPWLWPVLLVVWCNMHAGHAFGLGAVGLLVVSYAAYARLSPASEPARVFASWGKRAPWISLGLCFLALAVNPWGTKFLEFAASYAPGHGRSVFADEIVEWQPLGFSFDELRVLGLGWLTTFRGRFACVVLLAACSSVRLARRDAYPVLLALTSIAMAILARRFVELASLLCAPLVACTLASLAPFVGRLRARASEAAQRALPAASLAALAIAALLLHRDVRLVPDLLARWSRPDAYPRAALRYLQALPTAKRVFNYETWGGYQMFQAPGRLVFFDGRASTVYGEPLYADYLNLINGRGPVPEILARHRVEAVLIPRTHLIDVLLSLPKPWRIVYDDTSAVLLLPPDSPELARALPPQEPLLAREPQYLQRLAGRAMQAGDAPRALAYLQKAVDVDPFFVPAYTDLITLLATGAPNHVIEDTVRAARDELPHRASDFAFVEGMAYERRGDRQAALAAYRRAYSGGPLVTENRLLAAIDGLARGLPAPQKP